MKLKMEPERLKQLLRESLIVRGSTNCELSEVCATVSPEGINIDDARLNILAIRAEYRPSFFLEFDAEDQTKFVFSKQLLTHLSKFKEDDMVLSERNGKVRLEDKTGQWFETDALEHQLYPSPIALTKHEDQTFRPERPEMPLASFDVSTTVMSELSTSNPFDFEVTQDKQVIFFEKTDIYKFNKPIDVSNVQITGTDNVRIKIDGDYFFRFLDIMQGDVNIDIYSKGVSVVSKDTEERSLTYVLSYIKDDYE